MYDHEWRAWLLGKIACNNPPLWVAIVARVILIINHRALWKMMQWIREAAYALSREIWPFMSTSRMSECKIIKIAEKVTCALGHSRCYVMRLDAYYPRCRIVEIKMMYNAYETLRLFIRGYVRGIRNILPIFLKMLILLRIHNIIKLNQDILLFLQQNNLINLEFILFQNII